jgi:hypothetical protein
MGAIVAGWGAYWIHSGRRTRGGAMVVIGVLLMLAGPAGLGWFRAPLIVQAVVVTLVIGALASAAEFWVRSQRGQTPNGLQPESTAPSAQLTSGTSRTNELYSVGLADGPNAEKHEATNAAAAGRRKTPSRIPRRKSSARAARKSQ